MKARCATQSPAVAPATPLMKSLRLAIRSLLWSPMLLASIFECQAITSPPSADTKRAVQKSPGRLTPPVPPNTLTEWLYATSLHVVSRGIIALDRHDPQASVLHSRDRLH